MSAVKTAIIAKLKADNGVGGVNTLVGGRIHGALSPKLTDYPLVVVQPQRPPKGMRVFQRVGFEESVYLIRAVDRGLSRANVEPIKDRIRTLLEGATLTVAGHTCQSVEWVSEYEDETFEGGQNYQYSGGFYFVMTEPS